MMKKSFAKTKYTFQEAPNPVFSSRYGIYIHVPFCQTLCNFCPFYKEKTEISKKTAYVKALVSEIRNSPIHSKPLWVYFGGGSPSSLTIEELSQIVESLRSKVEVHSMGLELMPSFTNDKYIRGLKELGFSKVSLGVESFSEEVIKNSDRPVSNFHHIKKIIDTAKSYEIWTNTDIMVGLAKQGENVISEDIERISEIQPDQITIYPYMVIRGVKAIPEYSDEAQFAWIEKSWSHFEKFGYERKGIWTFAKGNNVYDSSREELIDDYVGFGPAAFSTYGNWKVVNPDLDRYLKNHQLGTKKALVALKSKATDDWRNFARMIYDLECKINSDFPLYLKLYIGVLKLAGYSKNGKLSEKGIHFAHHITKTVVESLPYPLQNPACVNNYSEYANWIT